MVKHRASAFAAALFAALIAIFAGAQSIVGAAMIDRSDRSAHGAMGAMGATVPDHVALRLTLERGASPIIRPLEMRVFEDNVTRLVAVTGDGAPRW